MRVEVQDLFFHKGRSIYENINGWRLTVPLIFRPGTLDDSFGVFEVFQAAILDLSRRTGRRAVSGGHAPTVLAEMWDRRRPLWEYPTCSREHHQTIIVAFGHL